MRKWPTRLRICWVFGPPKVDWSWISDLWPIRAYLLCSIMYCKYVSMKSAKIRWNMSKSVNISQNQSTSLKISQHLPTSTQKLPKFAHRPSVPLRKAIVRVNSKDLPRGSKSSNRKGTGYITKAFPQKSRCGEIVDWSGLMFMNNTNAYIYVHILCVYMYMYMCIYVYIYVYI